MVKERQRSTNDGDLNDKERDGGKKRKEWEWWSG